MSEQDSSPQLSAEMHSLVDSSKSNSEAFSILGMELMEVKAMLMTLIDLQKSSLMASGVGEGVLEENVQNLLEGYREKFLSALSVKIKSAASQQ